MRRRQFIGVSGALLAGAAAPSLFAPSVVQARKLAIAVDANDPGLQTLVAGRFRRDPAMAIIQPATDPLTELRAGRVDAAVLLLAALEPASLAAGVMAGLPFGPSPEALDQWLDGRSGHRLWHGALEPAGLNGYPIALLPAGTTMVGMPLESLDDIAGQTVHAPGPTAALWRRLGAVAGMPAGIRDGLTDGILGFGPRTRPIALVTTPDSAVRMGLANRRLLARLAESRAVDGSTPPRSGTLPAEVFVAAGSAWPTLRAELLAHPDPLTRAMATALLPLSDAEAAVMPAAWPWPDHRPAGERRLT